MFDGKLRGGKHIFFWYWNNIFQFDSCIHQFGVLSVAKTAKVIIKL